jgi:phage terminase small subunit
MPAKLRKIYTEETEEELRALSRDEVTDELSDKERKFCELYTRNYNVGIAAKKAGYKVSTAHVIGWKIRQKPAVNRYIAWLKLNASDKCQVKATDVIDHYTRIAFADISDFVEVDVRGKLKLINSEMIDGQLVKSIRQGKDGITVELYNKLEALEKLERYLDVMPADWKQQIEVKKLEVLQKRLELEQQKAGILSDEIEDDGFIEALKGSAKEVWEDSEDVE